MDLTKRDFLRGLAALGAAFPHAAQAKPKQRELFPNLSSALATLAKKNDVIFLADTNHRNLELRIPLSDPNFLAAAARTGITSIGIEYSRTFQPYVDDLAAGRLTKQDFVTKMIEDTANYHELGGLERPKSDPVFTRKQLTMMAREIEQIHKAGIKPVFIDPQHPIEQARTWKEIFAGKENEAVQKRLREYDGMLADDILQRKVDNGKMLVMYGFLHLIFASRYHVDDILRAKQVSTATILVTDNPLFYKTDFLEHKRDPFDKPEQPFGEGLDIPDRIYNPLTDYMIELKPETVLYKDTAPAIHPVHAPK